jgi:hypothetical protein
MVRTYWFFPGFYEASGNLDLQPFARIDRVEACRPRAMYGPILPAANRRPKRSGRDPSVAGRLRR